MDSRIALWVGFNVAVLAVLGIDLGISTRKAPKPVTAKAATVWTLIWVTLSVLFAGAIWKLGEAGVWPWAGRDRALEFLTAYVVEYALSVDNLFVFMMVFAWFRVKPEHQHKLLFWGVLSAFAMRAVLIGVGSGLVHRFHWLLYVFGAFLVYTAVKLLFQKDEPSVDLEHNALIRGARKIFPIYAGDHQGKFTVVENGKTLLTSLCLVLLVVESTDLLFALDSIPAVLGLSKDPFIIYSSNVCAVLGLRSLFFLVASLLGKFHYLKPALSAVLAFVGVKMMVEPFFNVSILISLGVIVGILAISMLVSLLFPPRTEAAHKGSEG